MSLVKVNKRKRRGPEGPRRLVASIETATVSCRSCRHAADPWLTNEDGKQEAEKDDDEPE